MSKNKLYIFFTLVAIYFLELNTYSKIVSVTYNYEGFSYSYDLNKQLISLIIVFLISVLASIKLKEKLYFFILIIVVCFLTFPALILFSSGVNNSIVLISHLIFFSIVYIGSLFKIKIKSFSLNNKNYNQFILVFIALMILPYFFFYKFNLDLSNLLLNNIYETRAIQKQNTNMFFRYSYGLLTSVFIPIALINSYRLQKWIYFYILIFLDLYLFLIGAHKVVLINLLIILTFLFFSKIDTIRVFVFGFFILLITGLLEYFYLNTYYVVGLLTRRVIFLPSLLDSFYFEFINKNGFLFWSNSWLKFFLDYPLYQKLASIIGGIYFSSWEINANNGIISDGYSQAGIYGVIFNSSIISVLFNFLSNLNLEKYYYPLALIFVFNIMSSALSTFMITHGGFIFLFLISFQKK